MKPALTPEEWAQMPNPVGIPKREDPLYFPGKHGIAAVNLRGESYGFSHADVMLLRAIAGGFEDGMARAVARGAQPAPQLARATPLLQGLADRIEALLPPLDPGKQR